jgi:predicted ATPase/DNA-binding CsgD family transcriptional regulator
VGASQHNLPASLTSFVGRESEMLEARRLLSMTRLLTLNGAGGCGKTRLALEVARDLVGTYPDGVWLVELAPLADPALVPQAVATALGVREQPDRPLAQTLAGYLESRQTLLVLDNCEHLVDAVAHLAEALLSACPKLRILATSREPLRVPGEALWPVSSLSLPDADRAPAAEGLMSYEAVRLFVDRARSQLPDFELTEENAVAVIRVCRKLDGIPLAIELAAARLGTLAVEQIAERLEDSLNLLTGGSRTAEPRQQTLRAALDWSYDLLSEAERGLLRRLSVFVGGWTLAAAEEVCSEDGTGRNDVLDLLSRLVDKSLVVAEASPGAAPRYRMLEPVRQYGHERLEESEDAERVRERHAGYYLALAEEAEPELLGAWQVAWLHRLETEYGNLRAALSWCLDEEGEKLAETGLRLAAALGRFWGVQGPREGRRWLEKGLAASDTSSASVRAKALNEAGFIAVYLGDPQSVALLEEGLALYKELGDRSGTALAITNMGHATAHMRLGERTALRDEAEALLREPLDERAAGQLLMFLGIAAQADGDHERVKTHVEEGIALLQKAGDLRGVAIGLTTLGMDALERGDYNGAAEVFEEDMRLLREIKDKVGIVYGLLGLAAVSTLRGRLVRAAHLLGAAEALRTSIGHPLMPHEISHYDHEGYLAILRTGLDAAAFDAAWAEGRAMSFEQAIEYALGTEEPTPTPGAHGEADRTSDTLTRREREVAVLIGRGLTNHQIATELDITGRTVETHVSRILRKLEIHSRTQIAIRVIERP